jgi:hypothetical protein
MSKSIIRAIATTAGACLIGALVAAWLLGLAGRPE